MKTVQEVIDLLEQVPDKAVPLEIDNSVNFDCPPDEFPASDIAEISVSNRPGDRQVVFLVVG